MSLLLKPALKKDDKENLNPAVIAAVDADAKENKSTSSGRLVEGDKELLYQECFLETSSGDMGLQVKDGPMFRVHTIVLRKIFLMARCPETLGSVTRTLFTGQVMRITGWFVVHRSTMSVACRGSAGVGVAGSVFLA